jgi:hypothetical protein
MIVGKEQLVNASGKGIFTEKGLRRHPYVSSRNPLVEMKLEIF